MGALGSSMYLEPYLNGNAARGWGKGLTIGSFIAYELRGTAKQYIGRYARALENACVRAENDGRVVGGPSAGRGWAWYPKA